MREMITHTVEETSAQARVLVENLSAGDVYGLCGDLGAGKTTFIASILEALGVDGPYTSPTFTIIKTYDVSTGTFAEKRGIRRIYHMDAYRVCARDMVNLGWQEMMADEESIIFIEWPEKIKEVLPVHLTMIHMKWIDDTTRSIKY